MLGLNLKGGPIEAVLSPKTFENVSLQTKQPAKLIQPTIKPTEAKKEVNS